VTVAGAGHADPCGEVEVSAVVFVVQQNTLSTSSEHAGCLLEDLREFGHDFPLALSMGRLSTIRVSDV
jgi:hypothetical protein